MLKPHDVKTLLKPATQRWRSLCMPALQEPPCMTGISMPPEATGILQLVAMSGRESRSPGQST